MQDQNAAPLESQPLQRSARFGTASLITSIIGAVLFCGVTAIAFAAGFTGNAGAFQGSSSLNTVSSLVMYCGSFLGIVGIILGIIGLAQKEKATLAVIGLVLGILIACSCAGLVVLGMSAVL